MKSSSPSYSASTSTTTNSINLRAIVLIAVFLSAASCIRLSEASSSHEAFSGPLCDRRLHHRCSYHHHVENSCSTWHPPPSWCLPFPRGRLPPPPQPPPPPPMEEEIDPRYGVEKRLVPTGPNPLHN
ncbi:CLAVATA3/ESR (CLE)-related protein 9-like [Phoenix dactylifera]|uniref:CLAVATA3/ESR (CLE)-related protein 9-like n=1 Tax=Phoenix dactylifera TaxID=42345 RepID=A0A8B8ZHB5_PHODC|nr:CLAVATA3/ESR (CLE)-related protein 9-like [Phoenix dactylifera]